MLNDWKDRFRVATQGNEYVNKVAEATSEEPWGPTGPQMEELSNVFCEGRVEIVQELQTRMENRVKSWRKCYKSLLVIDHLLRNMPEMFIDDLRMMAPLIKDISQSFHYTDDRGVDHGLSVRERAKKVHELLVDDALLKEERQKAEKTRYNCAGIGSGPGITTASSKPTGGGDFGGVSSGGHIGTDIAGRGVGGADKGNVRLRQEQENQDHILAMRLQEEEERRAANGGGGAAPRAAPPVPAPKPEAPVVMHHKIDATEQHQIDEDHRIAMALQRGEDPFANQPKVNNATSSANDVNVRRAAPGTSPQTHQPAPVAPTPPAPAKQPDLMSFLDDIQSTPAAPPAAQPQPVQQPMPSQPPIDPFAMPSAPAPPPQQQQPQQNLFAQPQQTAPSHNGNDFFTAGQSSQPTSATNNSNNNFHQSTDLFAQGSSSSAKPTAATSFFDQPPQQPLGQQQFAQPLGAAPAQQQQQGQPNFFGGNAAPLGAPPAQGQQLGSQPSSMPLGNGNFFGQPQQQQQQQQQPAQPQNQFEQQMAAFAGQKPPTTTQSKEKSLDQIMAEKRQGPSW